MKKHLRKILCAMMCLIIMLSGVNVFASQTPGPYNIKWRGDYSSNSKPKLIITVTSPVDYVQQVTAIIHKGAEGSTPALTDYIRIKEATVDEKGTKDITFTITEEFANTVTVDLKGNGYERTADTDTVYVIKPGEISDLLDKFNDESQIETALSAADNALELEYSTQKSDDVIKNDNRADRRINIMNNIKANDFGNADEEPENKKFADLEEARLAWHMSDIIAYIEENNTSATELKKKIDNNSDYINVDRDANYTSYINSVCDDILKYHSEYNGSAGVNCVKDFEGIINQYVGVRAVNAATSETIYGVFDHYNEYFEIPKETIDKYNEDFDRSNQDKALRAVYNKGFSKNSDLRKAFIDAVDAIPLPNTDEEGSQQTPPPSTEGPGAGIAGAGISGAPVPPAPIEPTTPAAPSFKDAPSSHWAYEYISKLAANGTISGYDDGTFRPNNNVTREEFVKMIIGATGLVSDSAECDFGDVPKDAWHYSYIASGYSKNIIGGIGGESFGIGRNITRQDVAVIAARILTYLNADTTQFEDTTLTDIDRVSDYAQDSVKLLNSMGIISGFDDGSFMPHNVLTRAEAAAIISRLTENL